MAPAPRVVFRDPPPPVAEARRLEEDLARALVNAPSLPVFLPPFRMFLNAVATERDAFVLRLGPNERSLGHALRIERPSTEGPAQVTVVERAAGDPRVDKLLAAMCARLAVAITPERWKAARAIAGKLRAFPIDVPLHAMRQLVDGVDPPAGMVRTGFRCNQDCGLCWQSRQWGDYGSAQVRTWIEDLAAAGVRLLTISGGEPTLDPELCELVAHARSLGFTGVTLETNAIQMAKPGYAERLRDAGVTECFVSLHSPDPAVSDAITRAPGTHARTVRGVQALLAAGIPVRLNAVMTAEGLDALPGLPDFIHEHFGSILGLAVSFPATPFERSLLDAIVPDPDRMRAALRRLIPRALDLGLSLSGIDGPCGVPLCAFGADPRVADLSTRVPPVPFRRHLPGCDRCAVRTACYGVREADADRFGDRCIQPIDR